MAAALLLIGLCLLIDWSSFREIAAVLPALPLVTLAAPTTATIALRRRTGWGPRLALALVVVGVPLLVTGIALMPFAGVLLALGLENNAAVSILLAMAYLLGLAAQVLLVSGGVGVWRSRSAWV